MEDSAREVQAGSLKSLYSLIRSHGEFGKRATGVHRLRKNGIVKDYLESKLIVAVKLHIAIPAQQFCFAFLRVPSGYGHFKVFDDSSMEIRIPSGNDMPDDSESNRVLVIRQFSQGANNVIAAGVSVRSWIWLVPLEYAPEPLVDASALEEVIKVGRALGPGVVNRFVAFTGCDVPGGEGSLVEGVAGCGQSLSSSSRENARDSFIESKLLDALSGLRINLSNDSVITTLEETLEGSAELVNCILCPTDRLARWLKLRNYLR